MLFMKSDMQHKHENLSAFSKKAVDNVLDLSTSGNA